MTAHLVDMSQLRKFVIVTDEQIKAVKEKYNKTDEDIKQDLQIIREWWAKQPHLPTILDDGELERTLMRNKFRIEQTKKKIDAYFTLRGIYSDFFPTSWEEFKKSIDNCHEIFYFLTLKKSVRPGERIILCAIKNENLYANFDMVDAFRLMFALCEICFKVDYSDSYRVIGDAEGISLRLVKQMDPNVIFKGLKLLQEGYSCRISNCDGINTNTAVEIIIKILKQFLKDNKIIIHNNLESLKEVVPDDYLPAEYGGNIGTLQEIQDSFMKELELHKDFLMERFKLKTDETKRIGESQYNDLFGSDGSFKKINLD